MNPQLNQAIDAFIRDEFKLESVNLNPDFDFVDDLGLTPDELQDFLQQLQEALSFSLPEEKLTQIKTLEDLYEAAE